MIIYQTPPDNVYIDINTPIRFHLQLLDVILTAANLKA